MADFDFEELDKAVTETLSDNNKKEGDSVPVPSPAMHRASAGKGYSDQQQARPHFEAAPTVRQAPSSSGRFMDMVHPSSDMRSHSTSKSRFRPPASYSQASSVQHNDDTHGEAPTRQGQPISNDDISSLAPKPLESPFLPDAKVEKRPLGGNVSTTENPISSHKDTPKSGFFFKKNSSPEPEAEAKVEPEMETSSPELDAILLDAPDDPRLEAPDDPQLDDGIDDDVAGAAIETETETPEVTKESSLEQSYSTAQTPATTSISQQYKEQQSAPAQQPGALYDTEAYHQPLPKSEKKHSGAWTIFWILFLVLIGAGVGAAAYFFVIPLL